MLLLALLISKIAKLNRSNAGLRKQLGEEMSTLKEAKNKLERAEKAKQVLETEKEDLISSHKDSLLHIASLLYITNILESKEEVTAKLEEILFFVFLKWKEAWTATTVETELS